MKYVLSLLFLLSIGAYGQTSLDETRRVYVSTFMQAVQSRDEANVIKLLSKAYVKEQLKGVLKGNREQFLNELFAGPDMLHQDAYSNVVFKEIIKMEIVEVSPSESGDFIYMFRLFTTGHDISAPLTLVRQKKNKTIFYRFEGGRG